MKFLTSVYRVTVNHFRMARGKFYRTFIIRVDYLFHYTKFFIRDTFFYFSFFIIIDRYSLLLRSWIIFLISGTPYGIFRMFTLFLHSRNRTLTFYYNKTTKRKCVTLSNLETSSLVFLSLSALKQNSSMQKRNCELKRSNYP